MIAVQICHTRFDFLLVPDEFTCPRIGTVTKGCRPASECEEAKENNTASCRHYIEHPECTHCCNTTLCNYLPRYTGFYRECMQNRKNPTQTNKQTNKKIQERPLRQGKTRPSSKFRSLTSRLIYHSQIYVSHTDSAKQNLSDLEFDFAK